MTERSSRASLRGWPGSIGVMTLTLTFTLCRSAAAGDLPAATMLFNEARRLVADGRYSEACPKFEESQRLDPGIGTQFNLADCFEHTGRTATAWALFLGVASAAGGSGQEARESVARKRAAALEPKLSKLTIQVLKNVEGLEVRRNGEAVNRVLWSSPVPVDPGGYAIAATAPGRKSWSTLTTVGPSPSAVTVIIPILEAEQAVTPPEPPGDSVPATPAAMTAASSAASGELGATDDGRDPPYKFIALALGGTAVVGAGIGTFFGLRSIAKHSDYEHLCVGSVCSPAAAPLHSDAVAAGNISTASFVASGVLAAGGAALWLYALYAPRPAARAGVRMVPTLGTSTAGVIVAGAF